MKKSSWTGTFLILAGLLWAGTAWGATYYIDYANGSDSNNGTSRTTAWKKAPGMAGFGGTYYHVAGDSFIFKGGVTWPSDCYPWVINYGGTSGEVRDYYGVDKTWYDGDAWTRPVLDNESVPTVILVTVNANYVTLDNFEVINFYWNLWSCNAERGYPRAAIFYVGYMKKHNYITNCYVHDWTHSDEPGLVDRMQICVQNAGGPHMIEGCVFDGSNDGHGGTSGMATYSWHIARNCIVRNMSNGILLAAGEVSNCDIGPINGSFDPLTHENAIEAVWIGRLDIFNNRIHDVRDGIVIMGKGSPENYYRIYNNLFYGTLSQSPISLDPRGGSGVAEIYNNTMVTAWAGAVIHNPGIPGSVAPWVVTARNNHVISPGPKLMNSAVTVESNNLLQMTSVAAAAGYVADNLYRPTSADSPTVNAGTDNVNGLFSNDLLDVSRPQDGTWDIGCYEYAAVPAVPGDADGDGDVDLDDFVILKQTFGASPLTDTRADFDGDGDVDLDDFVILKGNFGS
ncbi:MAG: hypothetical protein GX591_04550 [Planctomycetes bacterium]|nr:hypothetical protein [Planctomycetota bacterium]